MTNHALFQLQEEHLTLQGKWSVGIRPEVVMDPDALQDFVQCLRQNLGFSDGIKKLATAVNKLGRKSITTTYSSIIAEISHHMDQPTPHFLKNTCIRLLISMSILHMGTLRTASWCAAQPATTWNNFLSVRS